MPDIQNGTVLYSPYLLGQHFVADLTRRVQDGVSSEHWTGGFWDYSFKLTAAPTSPEEIAGLLDAFYTWLGYHVEKEYGGETVWDGMICQIDLAYGRIRRRRSLIDTQKPTRNAIRSTYTQNDIIESDELMENGGFETPSVDTDHTFETFGDYPGDGSIASVGSPVHGGAAAAALTAGATRNTKIGKTIHCTESSSYRLSFWARGNGTVAGRYEIYDVTNGASIVGPTSMGLPTAASYSQVIVDFTTPAGCSGMQFWFMCANTASTTVYFDDVSVKKFQPTEFTTDWLEDEKSIARHGRIEHTYENPAYHIDEANSFLQMELANTAWPLPYVISISQQMQTPTLEILVCGYWITAAWQESVVEVDVGTELLSDVLANLITTDCPFLQIGNIQANGFALEHLDGSTALKRIEAIVRLGDTTIIGDGLPNYYRAYVGPGRKFYYQLKDMTVPDYRLMPDGLRRSLAGPLLAPDQVHPGVIRDEAWPVDEAAPRANYGSVKDMWVTDVVSRGGEPGDLPELRTAEVDDADIYAAQVQYEKDKAL